MDAIVRISFYFPARTITIFQILSNMIINDSSTCEEQERSLVIAIIVLMAVACFCSSFTDTFTASNNQKFIVFIVPVYGPICFSLPTSEDKDRLYDYYFFKGRDLAHGFFATTAFVLISIFMNPVCMCLFPSRLNDGTSKFDSSIVRTVPIVVSLILALMMVCLGPPRQLIGFQNVPETCPVNGIRSDLRSMAENPMFQQKPPPTEMMGDDEMTLGRVSMPQKESVYASSNFTRDSRGGGGGGSSVGGGGGVGASREFMGNQRMRASQQQIRQQSPGQHRDRDRDGGAQSPAPGDYNISAGGYDEP